MHIPAALSTSNITVSRRLRLRSPKKQSAAARVAVGRKGLDPGCLAEAIAFGSMNRVLVATVPLVAVGSSVVTGGVVVVVIVGHVGVAVGKLKATVVGAQAGPSRKP